MLLFHRKRRLVLAMVLTVAVAGIAAGGCGRGGAVAGADVPVTVQADPRIFTLFAGLNLAGYDVEPAPAMDPMRVRVRESLASADKALFEPFERFMTQTSVEGLTELALKDIEPPPGFGKRSNYEMVLQLSAALKALWAAGGESLYNDASAAQADAVAALTGPATEAIHSALDYTHETASPLASVQVVPNLLAPHGFIHRRLNTQARLGYIVVGPADEGQTEAIYGEAFYLYLGEDLFRQLELQGKLSRFSPVFDKVKPVVGSSYASIQGFIEECLVRALVAKVEAPDEAQAKLAKGYDAGFVLAPAFYDGLAAYEGSGKALSAYVEDLLKAVDVNAVLSRVETQPPTGE